MNMHKKPGFLRILLAIALSVGALLLALTVGPASATAQVDDPYTTTTGRDCTKTPNHPDCRPTTTRPTPSSTNPPNCDQTPNRPGCRTTTTTRPDEGCVLLSIAIGPPGATVVVSIDPDCFPPDRLIVITFNGQPVLTLPPGSSGGQAALGGSGLAALSPANLISQVKQALNIELAQAARTGQFSVPSISPGTYPVCATAEGSAPACTNFTVTGVGGLTQGRGSGSGLGGSLTGAFANTGLEILPWLAVALVALAVGYALKRPARRRRHSTS